MEWTYREAAGRSSCVRGPERVLIGDLTPDSMPVGLSAGNYFRTIRSGRMGDWKRDGPVKIEEIAEAQVMAHAVLQ